MALLDAKNALCSVCGMEKFWDRYGDLTLSDLNRKSVDYEIGEWPNQIAGIGELIALRNPEGLIWLEVAIEYPDPRSGDFVQERFGPTELLRFRLSRHENPDVAAFRLSSYTPSLRGGMTDTTP